MKKIILILVAVCFAFTGCTGSFNLTRKVYGWHRSFDDKWLDEFGFLAAVIIPIYGVSTMADAIVFNSIEFWTGDNPVVLYNQGETTKHVKVNKTKASITYNPQDNTITIVSDIGKDKLHKIVLEKTQEGLFAKDSEGNVVYSAKVNDKGEYMVFDKDQKLIKIYTQDDIALMKDKYSR